MAILYCGSLSVVKLNSFKLSSSQWRDFDGFLIRYIRYTVSIIVQIDARIDANRTSDTGL